MAVVNHLWTLNLSAFHSVNWVFSLSLSWSTFMRHATPFSLSNNALSIVASCSASSSQCYQVFCRVTQCLKRSWKFTSAVKTTFVSILFESVLWLYYLQHSRTLVQVSYRRCGIHHGPPSMRLFLSTSAHHPGISIKNKFSTLISVCLTDRFSHSQT